MESAPIVERKPQTHLKMNKRLAKSRLKEDAKINHKVNFA